MKFCPFCGAKVLHEKAQFCAECGQAFGSSDNVKGVVQKDGSVIQSDRVIVSQKIENIADNRQIISIEKELAECRQYAENGYQLAQKKYEEIQNTLKDEKQRLRYTNREQDEMSRIKNAGILKEQDKEWKKLSTYVDSIQSDIEMLHENQKDFSIVIYGRTMAGKSTLMEILTHGNGQSIGKGKQRTTLDVRSYYWQGMRITDVPGICSFGGAEDDRLAMEAAKSADLILFLLTDDAPQAGEADCLAQLKQLGKPVLGIVNVKMSFDISRKKLAIRNLQNRLADTARIDSICEQFKDFAQKHQQDWSDIPFVYTHLNAAFQSQPERANDSEVYAASNFQQVEEFILEKVRKDGKFLRVKNFIDITAVPMQKIIYAIYSHSADAFRETVVYSDKIEQLYKWHEKFLERFQKKADRLYDNLQSEISREIDTFVDYNYENENAGKDWENVVNGMNLPERYKRLLEDSAIECERKRKELSDELSQEIRFTYHGNARANVEMGDTTPWGQYAALVLPNLLMFVPGIGWGARIAIGVGSALFSMFFDDKEAKIKENKDKLRQALAEGTSQMLVTMHNKAIETFNEEILDKGVNGFADVLKEMRSSLVRLGKAQGEVASALCANFHDLNLKLLEEASKYKGIPTGKVYYAVRLPGEYFYIFSDDWNGDTKEISSLLGEQIDVMPNRDVVKQILGTEFESVNIPLSSYENTKTTTILVPKKEVNHKNLALAQQISKLPIVTETM